LQQTYQIKSTEYHVLQLNKTLIPQYPFITLSHHLSYIQDARPVNHPKATYRIFSEFVS